MVRKFAAENFDNLLEVNLEKQDQKEFFKEVGSIEEFIKRAEFFTKEDLVEGKTLLFIDEIQELPEVLGLLRFFAEEKPSLHLIAAGSLLEAKMWGKWSVPVGRIEYMYLYPMTFFEYLDALGRDDLKDQPEVGELLLKKYFRDYLIIGGMPEVVAGFVKDNSYSKAQEIQDRLLSSYEDDIDKYARTSERKYLQLVMKYGPKVAGGVFKYDNFGDSGYRSREIHEAMDLLEKVMLLKQIPSINSLNLPLIHKYKRAKKMIWLDTGVVNLANKVGQDLLKGRYKGKIMEQVVAQALISNGLRRSVDFTYWARNKDEGNAEVDFCFQHGSKIVGLEVKSGNSNSLRSLFSMIDIGGKVIIPVRISWDPLKVETYSRGGKKYKILSLPFYLIEDIEKYIDF